MQQIYDREREIEMEIGVEDADAMAWEDEVERRFEVQMSQVCEEYEVWHQRIVEEVAENRRIEAEYDRTQIEYKKDGKWMAEELVALDLEEKLKWIQDENEEMEEIGERWDRLGPYTESDCEILQVAITVEEEEKEKDLPGPSTPARGRRKRRRGGQLTLQKRKRVKVESVPEKEKEEKYVQVFCVTTYQIIVIICTENV